MRDEILSALSVESVLKDVRFFSEETPHRLAGTPTERKAAEYIKAQFDAAGDFAQASVVAHEVGHHVQNLTGVLPRFKFPWNISQPYRFGETIDTAFINIRNSGQVACPFTATLNAL